jgi:hypothetical protein
MDKTQLLQNAINFAKQNPDSPQAVELRKRIESGLYNRELAQIKQKSNITYSPEAPRSFGEKVLGFTGGEKIAQGLGQAFANPEISKNIEEAQKTQFDIQGNLLKRIKEKKALAEDTSKLEDALKTLTKEIGELGGGAEKLMNQKGITGEQIAGDALQLATTVGSFGTYGTAAKGAEAGKLLAKSGGVVEGLASKIGIPTSQKIATPIVENVAQKTLGQTLKTIGKKTAGRAVAGAGTGYAYDVAQNLQENKKGGEILTPGLGTLVGAALPVAIGGIEAGIAITKTQAPRVINSLVKPRQADFSYGKNPGRTISEMGITGNNIDDFGKNITTARQNIGNQIGDIYSSKANAGVKINAENAINQIDDAIKDAARGGKGNQGIVTTLQNIKDSLLFEHAVDAEGNIVKIGNQARDLSKLSPMEAFDLKKLISSQTKFTGNPSDDKAVNSLLKNIYGGLKSSLNRAVSGNNPEIRALNQKYADLTSAELAVLHRSQIIQRASAISLPAAVEGTGAAIGAAILSGGAAIPTILAGAGTVALNKAFGSTAVKTRVAAWLGKTTPSVISKISPEIRGVLRRAFPMFASKLGK